MAPKFLSILRILTVCLWLLCTALLLLPKPWILFWDHNIPEEFGFGTGVEHIYMFGTLGFFVELSRRKWHPFTWLHILIAYGLVTEILQHFIPPRTCDIADFSQDCAGAYLGILVGLLAKRIYGLIVPRANSSIPR
ncbi:MAG: VanZ family protein [Planctomycetaceae bacterium]|nr:VanZ family protein [Planctomycetaceae bacterium]